MTQKISTIKLSDVINERLLGDAIAKGHVRVQVHPSEPLAILNYTERCAYEEAWTLTTLACRGLIFNVDTTEVVARGFNKFFNYEQRGAPTLELDTLVLATDKKDGSLGIIYPVPSGGFAVATRGSFASEQAIHATKVLNERYGDYRPDPTVTTLVEIVYPANRIVLDYGDFDDLILLGGQGLKGGCPFPPAILQTLTEWPGPVTETLLVGSFADVLAMPNRENAEGVVVLDIEHGSLVKIKQADYVALHKVVTGLTARKVHDHLLTGKPIDEFIAPLPDEFHPWVRQVAEDITNAVHTESIRLLRAYHGVLSQLPPYWTHGADRQARAAFAKIAAQHPDSWAMFALLDGRDLHEDLLKRARPQAYVTPTGRTYSEDVA